MDETGLFYCLAPDKTIAQRQVEGSKKSKAHVTVTLACNADGSGKREPFIIGHAKKPRCFQKKTGDQLGFYYQSSLKAWMTGVLFQKWLREFDDDMCAQRRNVVFLFDNASAHTVNSIELQSVTVAFLPSNTTSKLQPMGAGVITSFKRRYRDEVDQILLARGSERGRSELLSVHRARTWSYDHSQIADRRRRAAEHQSTGADIVRDLMDLDDFICCADEVNTEMEAFTAADSLREDVDVAFLATAQDSSDDDEPAESGATSKGVSRYQH